MTSLSISSFLSSNSSFHCHHTQSLVKYPPIMSCYSKLLKPVIITCSATSNNDNSRDSRIIKVKDFDSFHSQYEHVSDMAVVGHRAIEKANRALEYFVGTYFMFHGFESNNPKTIFKYLPLLLFVDSYIYQLDGLNEKISDVGEMLKTNQSQISKIKNVFTNDPFRPLLNLLESRGVLTDRMKEEFRRGEQYWEVERKLCSALEDKKEISIENALSAMDRKSTDFRIMNLLLYQLRGETVNELHMKFLSTSELLIEIKDDLFGYEDDVLENNFNIYRMFVGRYGSSAPAEMRKYISEAEEKYHMMLKCIDPILSLNYQKRLEEDSQENHRSYPQSYGPSFSDWIIPPPIRDEELFRISVLKAHDTANEQDIFSV